VETVTIVTTNVELFKSSWLNRKHVQIQKKQKATVIPLIEIDQLMYVLTFKSEDPSFKNLNNFVGKLKANTFAPVYVGLKENFSNEREYLRLIFLIYFDQSQWIKDQIKKINIGAQENKSGKRIFRMVNPWIEKFSFKIGNIKEFLTQRKRLLSQKIMKFSVLEQPHSERVLGKFTRLPLKSQPQSCFGKIKKCLFHPNTRVKNASNAPVEFLTKGKFYGAK
jgi:hypothetical protein